MSALPKGTLTLVYPLSVPVDSPLVSIITLTYNQEDFLPQCLDSVLAQTFDSWEQVVIDDESTDGTSDVLARYSDPRLRVIRQPHQGWERLPQTYQKALTMCRGRFIAFLDGDDYWPVDKLEALVPAFDDSEIVLSYGSTELFGNLSADSPPTIPFPDFEHVFPRGALFNTPVGAATRALLDPRALTYPYLVSVLLRRSTLDRLGGLVTYPGLAVMDHPTLLSVSLEGRFHWVERTMGFWRTHGQSTTTRKGLLIQAGIYEFIQEFRRTQAARLDLTPVEWQALDERWNEHLGRWSLRDGRWKDARSYFLRLARMATSPERRSLGLAGVTASALHRDLGSGLEWFFKRRVSRWLGRGT